MTMTEIQALLQSLMRTIDKKTVLTVELHADAERPTVTVQLCRDKRTGSLQFTAADLQGAQTDLMRRNQIRTALKRARDRMWEETQPIFSTKVEREKIQGPGWYTPAHRARGRR